MKLTFKDLKQQKFIIEVEPSETIADVKGKIAAEKGWEAALQKLIYSGKILQDANTVESYKIEEKGFIVCMVSKPKTSAASSSTAPAVAAAAAPPVPVAEKPQPPPAAPVTAPAVIESAPPAASTASTTPAAAEQGSATSRFNDPSALTIGGERDAAISNMESMGFARTDIDRAMRAAFYNPDRAVEYLLSGIPENALREDRPARPPTQPETESTSVTTSEESAPAAQPSNQGDEPINLFEAAAQANTNVRSGGTGRSGGPGSRPAGSGGSPAGAAGSLNLGNLEFLRNNPQFQQLRQVVQQQPQMLEPILQQVAAGNPQLAQVIAAHPEQFLQLLSENADEDAPLPPGAQAVSVTEEERDAIERLCRLGFERDLVIQAYFACDKNEELAANFLFDQPDDDTDP